MDPVDQGTLAMLALAGLMAFAATIHFSVRWYKKKQSKAPKIRKQRLKKTFSRFSQVDEELTVHVFHEPKASDRDLIQSYCEPDGHGTPTMAPNIQTVSLEVDMKTPSPQISQSRVTSQAARPSYLETDL